MIFKNCESLYCIPVTYIMLYINYTSIKKKGISIFRNRGTGSLECCLVENLQSGHSKETKGYEIDGAETEVCAGQERNES